MRIFFWLLYIVLFVAVLAFALTNSNPVDVRLFPGAIPWHVPVVVVVLVSFAVGVLVGLIASIPRFFRQRREIAMLRKELKARGGAAPAPSAPGETPAREVGSAAGSGTPPLPPYGV